MQEERSPRLDCHEEAETTPLNELRDEVFLDSSFAIVYEPFPILSVEDDSEDRIEINCSLLDQHHPPDSDITPADIPPSALGGGLCPEIYRDLDKMTKQREHYRMELRRVQWERNKLAGNMRRLQEQYARFEPSLVELRQKYVVLMKEKMLLKMDRDRLRAKLTEVAGDDPASELSQQSASPPSSPNRKPRIRWKPWPVTRSVIFEAQLELDVSRRTAISSHNIACAKVKLNELGDKHAAGFDDGTIRFWGNEIDSPFEVNRGGAFISGLSFHPIRPLLLSSSGDGSIALWGTMSSSSPACIIKEHNYCAWSVEVSCDGNYALSASQDQTAKLIDLTIMKSRQSFRGHVDSVNVASFCGAQVATASADKSVSLFDIRTGNCCSTFFGHLAAVSCLAVGKDWLLSGDTEGVVRVVDVRTFKEVFAISCGARNSVNAIEWLSNAQVLAGCKDGLLRVINIKSESITESMQNSDNSSVLSVAVGPAARQIFASDSTGTISTWNF